MRAVFFMILISIVLCGRAYADSAYKLGMTKDISISAGALGLFGASLLMDGNKGNPQSSGSVNWFDDGFVYGYNRTIDDVSTVMAVGVALMPFATAGFVDNNWSTMGTYSAMYGEALLLTYSTFEIIKKTTSRNRPYTYKGDVPSGKENDYYKSFPSAHTAFSFLGAGFLTSVLLADYRDSKWTMPLIVGSYSIAASVGVMRILSGSHFLSDVLVGAVISSFFAYFIPWIHKKDQSFNSHMSMSIRPAGLCFSMSF